MCFVDVVGVVVLSGAVGDASTGSGVRDWEIGFGVVVVLPEGVRVLVVAHFGCCLLREAFLTFVYWFFNFFSGKNYFVGVLVKLSIDSIEGG